MKDQSEEHLFSVPINRPMKRYRVYRTSNIVTPEFLRDSLVSVADCLAGDLRRFIRQEHGPAVPITWRDAFRDEVEEFRRWGREGSEAGWQIWVREAVVDLPPREEDTE